MSKSPTDPILRSSTGYLSGEWLPLQQMQIGVNDAGFRQAVTAVERLRTYSRVVFSMDAHLTRWQVSTATLAIHGLPEASTIKLLIDELLVRNIHWLDRDGDVGITLFATPGELHSIQPTFGMHVNRLNLERNEQRRRTGQPLIVTDVQQPSPLCWPRGIKVRSRIHYHLADSFAAQRDPDSVGVLLDEDGTVTETSIANLAVVRDGQIYSPPAERVLGGVTQSVTESLAQQADIPWIKQAITASQLQSADEVLMMGTDGGVWYVNSVDGTPVADGQPGAVYESIRDRFDEFVGISVK